MLDGLINAIREQLQNQIVSGGLVLAIVGVMVAALRNLPAKLWDYAKRALVVTAVIDSRNDLFNAYITWLNELPYGRGSRLFTVIQDNKENGEEDAGEGLPRLLYSPAPGFHLFWYGGRPMWIQRDIAMNLQVIETVKVSALLAPRRLLEEMLEDVIRRAYARLADHTMLYTIDRWGESWNLAGARPRRQISSVVLDGDTSDKLLADVREFFSRRQWYADLGIPWRRGYLLHGPPGTGKTSFAYALAGELHLKICALSLTNSKLNDQTISDLLQKTPPRSLILIEDIDAFFVARDKQDTRIEVSFSGLLNALDGVAAQEGRIVFLTTNHLDRLDKALIRPGRVDVVVELGNASAAMLRTMFLRFYPESAFLIDSAIARYQAHSLSPARIQQALLESDDPAGAVTLLGLQAA
ncbi:MAG TPA: AAA family ATPase [Rhodocyclaceae bacterium]|nr:AAA family ATPase [Rhodocyclaceae bacterium]